LLLNYSNRITKNKIIKWPIFILALFLNLAIVSAQKVSDVFTSSKTMVEFVRRDFTEAKWLNQKVFLTLGIFRATDLEY
jgi:hypothetical protein